MLVELGIEMLDNWKVDLTNSKFTDHTINLQSLLEVIGLKNGSQNCHVEQRQMRLWLI